MCVCVSSRYSWEKYSSFERPNIKRNYKFLVLAFALVKGRLMYAGREEGQASIRGFIRCCGRGNILVSTIVWFKSCSSRSTFIWAGRSLKCRSSYPVPPLWLDGWVKGDSDECSVLPKTLNNQKKKIQKNIQHLVNLLPFVACCKYEALLLQKKTCWPKKKMLWWTGQNKSLIK